MKKLAAFFLLCLFALLLIAAISPVQNRPQRCRTRSECVMQWYIMATMTATPTQILIETPRLPAEASVCDTHYPNPYIPGTCAHATLESELMVWTEANCAVGNWHDGRLSCYATLAPPATAPPAGYP